MRVRIEPVGIEVVADEIDTLIRDIQTDHWHAPDIPFPPNWQVVEQYQVTLLEGELQGQTALAAARYIAGDPPTLSLNGKAAFA
jgi:hypothetical protein